ncbi:histidine-rich glycoprotein-like [Brassica rapa]|uniref:histidine-rich glycoprotein-like n=1 Tax=Brassica campestris TaxID=3711 RepID=UPI00142DB12F|nr:histidine-rich glycoprotein-like [Brassica rapa]XP_048633044.1 histidine-rich glycoprotein-like [Brassica napus]
MGVVVLSCGHRTRASSTSPPHRPYEDHRHGSDLNHSGAPPPPRGREFSGIRESSGRYIDYSPPRHKFLDFRCRNLNFARREVCYKCNRHRYARVNSPPPPPMNLSPRRNFNGYRSSPPSGYPRDYPPPRLDHPTWKDGLLRP